MDLILLITRRHIDDQHTQNEPEHKADGEAAAAVAAVSRAKTK